MDAFRENKGNIVSARLRCGVVSGEDLLPMDSNGKSDPVVRIGVRKPPWSPVSFLGFSKPAFRTLNPTFTGTTAGCIPSKKDSILTG